MKNPLRLTLSLMIATYAFAGTLSPDLKGLDPRTPVRVVVQLGSPSTPAVLNALKAAGVTIQKQFDRIPKTVIASVPAARLKGLASLSFVKYVSPDRSIQKHLDLTTATVGAAQAFNYGLTGSGIGVAVVDSGIDTSNADLAGRVVYSEDFTGEGLTGDLYGHGTHVAGIVGGSGANSAGKYRGVAPGVNLINLRVLDEKGMGSDSAVIAAINRAIDLQSTYNIRVVNISLGRPVYEAFFLDPLCQAVEAANQAGIVVVVAAGNEGRDNYSTTMGYATITVPGNDPFVITVGAMKSEGTPVRGDDLIASYSSKGPTLIDHFVKPDIVAPGNLLVSLRVPGSTLDTEYPGNQIAPAVYGGPAGSSSQYFLLNGTSMAAPVVSGAAAIMLQQYPNLNPHQVKARLMKTASKSFPASSTATDPVTGMVYTSYYDMFTVGAGYLDIGAALNNTDVAKGTAPSPVARFNQTTSAVSIVNPNQITWGLDESGLSCDPTVDPNCTVTQITWGDQIVWGLGDTTTCDPTVDPSCTTTQITWGDQIVWGTNAFVGDTNTAWTASGTPLASSTTSAFSGIWSTSATFASSTASAEQTPIKGEK